MPNKIQFLKREYSSETTNALLVIEKKLSLAKDMVYPRLSSTRSSRSHCSAASALGERVGSALTIATKPFGRLLTALLEGP